MTAGQAVTKLREIISTHNPDDPIAKAVSAVLSDVPEINDYAQIVSLWEPRADKATTPPAVEVRVRTHCSMDFEKRIARAVRELGGVMTPAPPR